MPHRKLVKIGESPKLPTIQEFFQTMAERQHEEIRRLKEEVAGLSAAEVDIVSHHDPRMPVPDPWLLHPVRIKRAPAKKAAKKATKKSPKKKTAVKRASSRKPAKKTSKKK